MDGGAKRSCVDAILRRGHARRLSLAPRELQNANDIQHIQSILNEYEDYIWIDSNLQLIY